MSEAKGREADAEPADWRVTAARCQQRVLDSIPEKWRIPSDVKAKHTGDARSFAVDCGILTPRQIEITQLNASELLERIHSRELSAVEATDAFCARAAVSHQLLNCLTEFTPESALAQAKLYDELAVTGKLVGPLHGMPMAVKDIMHVKGSRATLAWVAWADNPPSTADSSAAKVMRDAGAIFFGRTTMPQTGMALETTSNLWGRTLNPFNPIFGAGGSSGGDAALCAMRGEPAAPITTDIGGSIRIPGAFNGLYAMRPTADRVPRDGLIAVAPGNVSIKVAVGPCVHSLRDLKLFTKLILTHPTLPYEPTTILPYWNDTPTPTTKKLRVAVITTDGIVDPHPPIKRVLRETSAKLRAAGHEVFEYEKVFDFWAAALVIWPLYFQTGAKEHRVLFSLGNEPPIPQFAHNHSVFNIKELSVSELFSLNAQQAGFKAAFQAAWDAQAIDVILCPCSPMVGVPHDFPVWWGYTAIWNLLDYPSIVMPVKDFKISSVDDPKDVEYAPRENPFDRKNWEVYDPDLWTTQPMTLQIVGRPYRDETLIANCELIDQIVNARS